MSCNAREWQKRRNTELKALTDKTTILPVSRMRAPWVLCTTTLDSKVSHPLHCNSLKPACACPRTNWFRRLNGPRLYTLESELFGEVQYKIIYMQKKSSNKPKLIPWHLSDASSLLPQEWIPTRALWGQSKRFCSFPVQFKSIMCTGKLPSV